MKNKKTVQEKKFQKQLFSQLVGLSLITLAIAVAFFIIFTAVFSQFEIFNLHSLIENGFFYVIVVLVFCMSTIISIFISKKFSEPLSKLSDATRQVAQGNFEITLERPKRKNGKTKKPTEIDLVYDSFNKMVTELKQNEMFKSDFISNVSHEMKTPLATIQGYATLLQNDKLTKKEKQEYLNTIITATKQLSNLTSNILKLSKLENQSIFIEPKEYNLAEQIRRVILSLESLWSKKDIDFTIDLDEISSKLDESLIEQVWKNLIENAIKFSNPQGKIEIKLNEDNDFIIATIKDHGLGMDEKTKTHLFDKFYQGDNSHSKEGNGLGLSLVKKILDIHNAEIIVDSKINKGATFIVKFKK